MWQTICRRTNDPKLAHFERWLANEGIQSRRMGESFHAPILQVQTEDMRRAQEMLELIDDLEDDDERFV